MLLRSKFTLVDRADVPRLFYTCDDVTVWQRKGDEHGHGYKSGVKMAW